MGQWDEINKSNRERGKRQKAFHNDKDCSKEAGEKEMVLVYDDEDATRQQVAIERKLQTEEFKLSKEIDKSNAFELAEKNLYNFRYLMLDNNIQEEFDPASFHFRWSDHLINGKGNIAILGFRGCGKSEYVLRAFPLYCLAFPDESRDFIVILKHGQEGAEEVIKSIRKEYETSALLKHNLVKINESSAKCFEAEVRNKNGKIIRVRIMGFGKGTSIRGLRDVNRRPRVIIGDDLQDKKDFVGEKVHETDWSWFKTDVKHLGSINSRMFMIGNNLGEKCIMERIRKNQNLLGFDFEVVPQAGIDWAPNWPARDTRESILKERDNELDQGSIAYSEWLMEKMCEAVNDRTRIFTKDKFKYYVTGTEHNFINKCKLYLLSDLASSTKKTADYRVLLLLAVDQHNNWFVIECPYGQWDTKRYMQEMFRMVKEYDLDSVYMENGQILQSIRPFMQDEMSKSDTFFRINELKADRRKEERIALLQPRFESGSIYFPQEASWLHEMEHELLSFTMEGAKSLHDDLIDTLAYAIKVAKPANPRAINRKRLGNNGLNYKAKRLVM